MESKRIIFKSCLWWWVYLYNPKVKKEGEEFEDKVTAENFVRALDSIGSFTEYKVPEIKNKKDLLRRAFENYLNTVWWWRSWCDNCR